MWIYDEIERWVRENKEKIIERNEKENEKKKWWERKSEYGREKMERDIKNSINKWEKI